METMAAASRTKGAPRTMDTIKLGHRFRAAQTNKSQFEQSCDQIEKFIAPFSGGRIPGNDSESSVEWKRLQVWDFTAIDGSQKLAANMHGSVTSPAIRWYRMNLRDKTSMDDPDARAFADEVTDRTFDALQDSDFNTEISCAYLDLVAFGNAFVMCEPVNENVWEGLDFTAIPIREGFFEEDCKGRIKTFFRLLSWSAAQIEDKFGAEGLPDLIVEALKSDQGRSQKFDVVFCVDERPDRMKRWKSYKRKPAMLAKHLRPYGSCYFLLQGGDCLGEEGGYYEMPVFLARWEKTPGSAWGHGPGHTALPTVKYLNAWMELVKKAQEKQVDPTTLVNERGLLSDIDHAPGKMVVVRDPEKDVKILETSGRTDVGDKVIAELRAMVRQIFHVDELQLKDSPAMTATEVQVRYELMNRVLGSTLARLQSDLLDPLLHLVIAILARARQLPKTPAVVRDAGGDYSLEYQGPLSRAQRTDEVAAIERGAAFVAGLLKMGFEEVKDDFDPGEAVREAFKRLGVPAKVLPGEAARLKRRKARQELMMRVAQAEAARAEGEAAQQGADAVAAAQGAGLPVPARPGPLVAPTLDQPPMAA
jgi:hypothetical protein